MLAGPRASCCCCRPYSHCFPYTSFTDSRDENCLVVPISCSTRLLSASISRFAHTALEGGKLMNSTCRLAKAKVVAESDGVTTEIGEKCHTFMIDEPKQLGGKGEAASPLGHFLGGLIGCTQITLHTIAQEQQVCTSLTRACYRELWRPIQI